MGLRSFDKYFTLDAINAPNIVALIANMVTYKDLLFNTNELQ